MLCKLGTRWASGGRWQQTVPSQTASRICVEPGPRFCHPGEGEGTVKPPQGTQSAVGESHVVGFSVERRWPRQWLGRGAGHPVLKSNTGGAGQSFWEENCRYGLNSACCLTSLSPGHQASGSSFSLASDGLSWILPPPIVLPAASEGFPGALSADLALREAAPERCPCRDPLRESLRKGCPAASVCSQPRGRSLHFGLGWGNP